jgi:hypothetical protein
LFCLPLLNCLAIFRRKILWKDCVKKYSNISNNRIRSNLFYKEGWFFFNLFLLSGLGPSVIYKKKELEVIYFTRNMIKWHQDVKFNLTPNLLH